MNICGLWTLAKGQDKYSPETLQTVIQVILQNPNGVLSQNKYNSNKQDGLMNEACLATFKDAQADVIGIPETNINWRYPYLYDK